MTVSDFVARRLKKAAKGLGIKEEPSETEEGAVKFVVFDDHISIKDNRGGMVTYKLDFLRWKIARMDKDGEDWALEKRALEAYDKHVAEQRKKLEAELNKRANRVKKVVRHRHP